MYCIAPAVFLLLRMQKEQEEKLFYIRISIFVWWFEMNPIPKTAVVRWLLCAPFFFSVCNSGVFKSLLLTDCVCDCWVDWICYKRNVRVILLLCCCWRNWISHHLKLSAWSIDISVSNVVWESQHEREVVAVLSLPIPGCVYVCGKSSHNWMRRIIVKVFPEVPIGSYAR